MPTAVTESDIAEPLGSSTRLGITTALTNIIKTIRARAIRLSFATSMEQIDKGLDRLEKLLG